MDKTNSAQRMVEAVKRFVAREIDSVKVYVAKSVGTLDGAIDARLTEIDAKILAIPAGPQGESIQGQTGERGEAGQKGEPGPAGKDADLDSIKDMLAGLVRDAVAVLPKAKDGVAGAPGKDGSSVHPDTIAVMVAEQVTKAVAAIPQPKDGIAGADGRDAAQIVVLPGIDESRSYPAGTYAKHNGGEIRAERRTDPVKAGDIFASGWTIARDGVSAIVVTQGDDPRQFTVAAMLTSGTKAITDLFLPVMIYREVWREGEYTQGDVVTWDGSAWHCQADKTTDKPDGTSRAWKLMVKRGAPGKDAASETLHLPNKPVRLR